jgi:fatty acid desaturase
VAFVAAYFALVAVQWGVAPTNLWLAVPLVVATCWTSFFCATATHNTVHCPVFRSRRANRVFQVLLTLTYGHPVSAYVPGHNLSHHRFTQTRRDVMRTTKVAFRWNLLNGLAFMPRVGGQIFASNFRYFVAMWHRNPRWFRQLAIEAGIFLALAAALLALDWRKFLLYVLVPHQYAAWGIFTINYLQHDGTDEDSPHNHSRNFVGRLVNWFTFNNGFHAIHHTEPGLHWSLLPEAHAARVAPFNHPALNQRSLLAYIFTAFVWPARRLRYDGTPVVLPVEGPDLDWIAPAAAIEAEVSLGAVAS